MARRRFFSPLTWPVLSFGLAILTGSLLLWWSACQGTAGEVDYVDALFTATSAVCVTGLSSVNITDHFNAAGHAVIMLLIQLGGLGITTYTSLLFLLWREHVPFTDRLAVTRALQSRTFNLGVFLRRVLVMTLLIECTGALALFLLHPDIFGTFGALFSAVSAFCNAGFSLLPNNLERFSDDWPVNLTFMALIVLGGVGFGVLEDTWQTVRSRLAGRGQKLSRYTKLVYATSFFLIPGGALLIWITETLRDPAEPGRISVLSALFHSVSARSAGFNTVPLNWFTDAGLLVIIGLMFVGGAPGSCAGGVKITTFRVLTGFIKSRVRGDEQIVLAHRAVSPGTLTRALTLFSLATALIWISALCLSLSEGRFQSHMHSPVPFIDILFEVVSAAGTAGLSTGLTPRLTPFGKLVIIANMFIGRVGLITLLAALHSLHQRKSYTYPETDLPIG